MGDICRFDGVRVRIHYNEHPPPHFHAYASGGKLNVQIRPVKVMAVFSFPRSKIKDVLLWAENNQDGLELNWMLAQAHKQLQELPPP